MKRSGLAVLAIFLCLTAFTGMAFAAGGNIQMGKLTVLPSLRVAEEYDDNIFYSPNNETDDFITKIDAQLGAVYDITGRGNIGFGASGLWALYADTSDNDWSRYNLYGNLNYRAPAGFYATINERYVDSEDPYGSDNQFAIGVQTKRWTNTFGSTLGYELQKRYRAEVYFSHYKQDYDEEIDFTQNYDRYRVGLGGSYRIMPKTWAFLRYRYGERDYNTHPAGSGSSEENDADYEIHRVNAGVAWEATAKLNGELNLGYQWNKYENERDLLGNPYEDIDFWIARTSLTYTPTAKTGVTFSFYGDFRPNASTSNAGYKDYGFDVSLNQEFLFDFIFLAGAGYSINDYENLSDREDDLYRFNLGVDYVIKPWLKTGVYYNYLSRDSSSNNPGSDFGAQNEYDINRIGIYLKGEY